MGCQAKRTIRSETRRQKVRRWLQKHPGFGVCMGTLVKPILAWRPSWKHFGLVHFFAACLLELNSSRVVARSKLVCWQLVWTLPPGYKKTSPGKPQKPQSQRSVDSDSFSGNTCNCNLFVKLWDVCRIPNQYQNGWRGHFSLQTAPASTPKSQQMHPEKSWVKLLYAVYK